MMRAAPWTLTTPTAIAATLLMALPGQSPAAAPGADGRSYATASTTGSSPNSTAKGVPSDPRAKSHSLPAKLRPNRQYTYRVENLPSRRPASASEADVYASIDRSFRQWEAFTAGPLGISFRALVPGSRERADITIKFGTLPGSAGDDASSGMDCVRLCRDGDPAHIWLNDARSWTPTELGGDGHGALELLVLHELGHLLGLPHFNADKCEGLAFDLARTEGDCLGARAVMTRFLAVTLPGPFVMPIRCTDLAGLERVYGVAMQSDACADHVVAAPDQSRRAGGSAYAITMPRVQVLDAAGRPVKNVVVSFSVSGGEASGLIQVTDSSGFASLGSWTVSGGETASAAVPGLGRAVRFAAPLRDQTIATSTP